MSKKKTVGAELVVSRNSAGEIEVKLEETEEGKSARLAAERADDAYERPGDLYRTIADAGGLGWLHLPTQDKWEEMQKERRDETE